MKNLKKTLKKSLGQNFLINQELCSDIVALVPSTFQQNILEIGCGNGALTRFLVNKECNKYTIVELDERWAKYVREEFGAHYRNVEIKNENILDFKLNDNAHYVIVGNIPYNITHLILKKIISWCCQIDSFTLMMQEEVAQKLIKKKGAGYGPISVIMQLLFHMKLYYKISPKEFVPSPRVFSRIMQGKKEIQLQLDDLFQFQSFLEKIFRFPRKKIKNQTIDISLLSLIDQDTQEKRAQEMTSIEIYQLYKKIAIM